MNKKIRLVVFMIAVISVVSIIPKTGKAGLLDGISNAPKSATKRQAITGTSSNNVLICENQLDQDREYPGWKEPNLPIATKMEAISKLKELGYQPTVDGFKQLYAYDLAVESIVRKKGMASAVNRYPFRTFTTKDLENYYMALNSYLVLGMNPAESTPAATQLGFFNIYAVRFILDKANPDQKTLDKILKQACDAVDVRLDQATTTNRKFWGPQADGVYFDYKQQRVDIINLLIDHKANPNANGIIGTGWSSGTPLHIAARNGSLSLMEVLIKRGGNVNISDFPLPKKGARQSKKGLLINTPLVDAALSNNAEMVKFLLTHGANPNARVSTDILDPMKNTVSLLQKMKQAGNIEIVTLLEEAGAK